MIRPTGGGRTLPSVTGNPCVHGLEAGAYVLGALRAREHEAYERHLRECEPCRAEVAELRVAADALPLAAPWSVPPPRS